MRVHHTAEALAVLQSFQEVYTTTATECLCCGKALRDALSVTRGIGPDCSGQHYDGVPDPSEEQVQNALGGILALSMDDSAKIAILGHKSRPRDLANLLLWWASAHQDDLDTVLGVADIVTHLGFQTLGDRVRERNTNVVIKTTESGDLLLRCKSRGSVKYYMSKVREAIAVPREGRFKYGWTFPQHRLGLVLKVLGIDFGNEWATMPGDTGPRVVRLQASSSIELYKALDAAYRPAPPPAPVVKAPEATAPAKARVERHSNVIEVYTPRCNWKFVSELKLLPTRERSWNPQKGCWAVSAQHEPKVLKLVEAYFAA